MVVKASDTNLIKTCGEAIDDLMHSMRYQYVFPLMIKEMIRSDTEFLVKKIIEASELDGKNFSEEKAYTLAEKIKDELWETIIEQEKDFKFDQKEKTESKADMRRRKALEDEETKRTKAKAKAAKEIKNK